MTDRAAARGDGSIGGGRRRLQRGDLTRELIVRENRKYARRQLIWFRKEPNLRWIHAAGERADTQDEVARLVADRPRV